MQTGLGIRTADDLAAVAALFEEANGRVSAFRFRDWTDYRSCAPSAEPAATDQHIGTGDGTVKAFRLRKQYGQLAPYWRPITKPEAGTVRVAVNGIETATGWTVDNLTGILTFTTAPAAGAIIRAGFRFFVPVRFDTDTLAVDLTYFRDDLEGLGTMPDIPLIKVRDDLD